MRFQDFLKKAGFDKENPDPAIAWATYKQVLIEPYNNDDKSIYALYRAFTESSHYKLELGWQFLPDDINHEFFVYTLMLKSPLPPTFKELTIDEMPMLGTKLNFFGVERQQAFHALIAHSGVWVASFEKIRDVP